MPRGRPRKILIADKVVAKVENATPEQIEITDIPVKEPKESLKDTIEINKKEWDAVQAKLKMLYEVADKGRVFNYESRVADKKPRKIKLSVFGDGIIVGWRTLRDELVKHPTTGLVVGENQEYELQILKNNGDKTTIRVNGYPAFSNARYSQRIEAEIVSQRTDYDGSISFDVALPDGRIIQLGSQFVN